MDNHDGNNFRTKSSASFSQSESRENMVKKEMKWKLSKHPNEAPAKDYHPSPLSSPKTGRKDRKDEVNDDPSAH